MHEFSIVQNITEIVLDSARRHGVEHVSAVEVEVGQASGVVKEAMEFAWEAVQKGTLLNNTVLRLIHIPLKVKCGICQHQYMPDEMYESCPACGETNPEIIAGRELRVVAIET